MLEPGVQTKIMIKNLYCCFVKFTLLQHNFFNTFSKPIKNRFTTLRIYMTLAVICITYIWVKGGILNRQRQALAKRFDLRHNVNRM